MGLVQSTCSGAMDHEAHYVAPKEPSPSKGRKQSKIREFMDVTIHMMEEASAVRKAAVASREVQGYLQQQNKGRAISPRQVTRERERSLSIRSLKKTMAIAMKKAADGNYIAKASDPIPSLSPAGVADLKSMSPPPMQAVGAAERAGSRVSFAPVIVHIVTPTEVSAKLAEGMRRAKIELEELGSILEKADILFKKVSASCNIAVIFDEAPVLIDISGKQAKTLMSDIQVFGKYTIRKAYEIGIEDAEMTEVGEDLQEQQGLSGLKSRLEIIFRKQELAINGMRKKLVSLKKRFEKLKKSQRVIPTLFKSMETAKRILACGSFVRLEKVQKLSSRILDVMLDRRWISLIPFVRKYIGMVLTTQAINKHAMLPSRHIEMWRRASIKNRI